MRIGGFQKFSLIDYPGKMAALVFTQGCNFRCGYCHNPQLACPDQFQPAIDEGEILDFLETRQGKLQGVVVTGGEPTIHKDLPEFLGKLKAMGFSVKLDTNGSNPGMLRSVIEAGLVDFIAMDIKTSMGNYEKVVRIKVNVEDLKASIAVILAGRLGHQFRTTLVKSHCSLADLEEIQGYIKTARHYVLQSFIPWPGIIDPKIALDEQYTAKEVEELRLRFQLEHLAI